MNLYWNPEKPCDGQNESEPQKLHSDVLLARRWRESAALFALLGCALGRAAPAVSFAFYGLRMRLWRS